MSSETCQEIVDILRIRDGEKCCYCKQYMFFAKIYCNDKKYRSIEHIIKEFGDRLSNFKLACQECNNVKVNSWTEQEKLDFLKMTRQQCQQSPKFMGRRERERRRGC